MYWISFLPKSDKAELVSQYQTQLLHAATHVATNNTTAITAITIKAMVIQNSILTAVLSGNLTKAMTITIMAGINVIPVINARPTQIAHAII